MIIASIDLRKIDQSKCKSHANGAKYCELILMENRDGEDKYGNTHMVVQGVSKEDREAGIKGVILGNAKTKDFGSKAPARKPPVRSAPNPSVYKKPAPPRDPDDDMAF